MRQASKRIPESAEKTVRDMAMAQETCASKAVGKNGRPLAGAALNSFLKKCKREACKPKAVSVEGKKLSGAAKNSFMQKCERDARVHAELSRPISVSGDHMKVSSDPIRASAHNAQSCGN